MPNPRSIPLRSLATLALALGLPFGLAACTQAEDRTPTAVEAPVAPPTSQPAPPSGSALPSPGVPSPVPTPVADECGAGKLGDYLNQLPTSDVMAKIRALVSHDRIRTINPGDAVTMDLRPDRLNVEIGADGRIKRLRCG